MKEIIQNGPVQAIMQVHEDFFHYKSGIYRHVTSTNEKSEKYRKLQTHAVKLTGWTAQNYSQFWGMTLEEGFKYRLGTLPPSPMLLSMNEVT